MKLLDCKWSIYDYLNMNIIWQLQAIFSSVQNYVPYVLHILVLPWLVQIVNALVGYKLNVLGILPRVPVGMLGIVFCPLLHGSFSHIFMNSFFFFALALMVLLQGKQVFWVVVISVTVLSGLMVWLFARRALHVGASGLVVGLWSYSVTMAYYNPRLAHVLAAAVGIFYFGTDLLASMLPQGKKVSVEGHIAGFIAGVMTASYFPVAKQALNPLLPWLVSM